MRDLLFKHLTSDDHRRRVIASSEIVDKAGVRTTVHRHFIYMVRQISEDQVVKQPPHLAVIKERNTKKRFEKFYCQMKGTVYALCNGRTYAIDFMHSLRISLLAIPEQIMKYTVD